MHTLSARFSPVWGWALAGAVAFPGLMALGYLSTRPLIALAVAVGGAGLVAGAAVAAVGRREAARESAHLWVIAYVTGVLVYLTWLEFPGPLPDNMVVVTPDGPGQADSDARVIARMLTSIGVVLVTGGALDGARRSPDGQRRLGAIASAAAWAIAMVPLPVLIVMGIYATSMVGDMIRFGAEVPVHLFGLLCSGAVTGAIVGGTAEAMVRRLKPSPLSPDG
jgi:hypothetical protein